MTTVEVRKLVAMIFAAFPGTRSSPATAEIYERMLLDQDSAIAAAAVERLLATSKFMPTIAEVREACLVVGIGDTKQGGEAWGDVLRLIGRYGAYRAPGSDFEIADPIALRCVQALGWQQLCASDEPTADRARFIDLYDRLATSERKEKNTSELPNQKRLESATSSEAHELVKRLALAKRVPPPENAS